MSKKIKHKIYKSIFSLLAKRYEPKYFSLVDLIISLENINKDEYCKIYEETNKYLLFIENKCLTTNEFKQLSLCYGKSTMLNEKTWNWLFNNIPQDEYYTIPTLNKNEIIIAEYQKFIYNKSHNQLQQEQIDNFDIKDIERWLRQRCFDAKFEELLKQKTNNLFDYSNCFLLDKNGELRCGFKGVIINWKNKKSIFILHNSSKSNKFFYKTTTYIYENFIETRYKYLKFTRFHSKMIKIINKYLLES